MFCMGVLTNYKSFYRACLLANHANISYILSMKVKRQDLGLNCWHGVATPMTGAHTHMEIEANLIHQGALTYLFGGKRVEIRAGEWAIFWGSVPHQLIEQDTQTRVSWFTLPLATFLSWAMPTILSDALLHSQVIVQTANLPADAMRFAQWNEDLNSSHADRQVVVELEMQARLRRVAFDWEERQTSAAPTSRGEVGAVEKMSLFVAQNYFNPLQIADITAVSGLHANYAMNLFKREFDLSLGEFLTRTRIAQVQRLLVTTDRTVTDIAFSCGFGSASRFHAVFKKQCGQSPANYRKSLRS